jgi:ABC-2 type transport system ATP-binding protein
MGSYARCGHTLGVVGSRRLEVSRFVTNALDLVEVSKRFPGRCAVEALSLGVKSGEVYGFLGKNGAGKTTTIKMVLGLLAATQGEIRVFGQDARDPRVRARIGFCPERASFYDYLTTYETLEFFGGLSGMSGPSFHARIREVLAMVGLDGEENNHVRTFSKGMQQRLGIAQSLLGNPDLLIFDEPTTGLDPFGRSFVKKLILDLKAQGKTVFFSSHQLLDVQEVCDCVGVIHHGKLVYGGTVTEFLDGGRSLEDRFVELILRLDGAAGRKTQLE